MGAYTGLISIVNLLSCYAFRVQVFFSISYKEFMTMIKNRFFRLSFLFCLIFSVESFSATTDVVKKVTGYGKTQDAALGNALVEAVSQIEGIAISKVRSVESDLTSLFVASNAHNSVSLSIPRETVLGRVKGYIRSYDVLSSNKNKDGWRVVVKVKLEQYKALSPERNGMLKVVVYPFRMRGAVPAGFTSSYVQDLLHSNLTTYLTQTGKYRVLDRKHTAEYTTEAKNIQSALSHPREALSMGQKLGADYILVGDISYLALEKINGGLYDDSERLQITGDIEYRLIEVATQEVSIADTYSFTAHERKLRNLLRKKTAKQAVKTILDLASSDVGSAVMDSTFPIKILQKTPAILLSQGGKRVQVGDVFDVYGGSTSLKDPDTGLNIKIRGEAVAQIKVTSVAPQYSTVSLLSGAATQIKKNALVFKSKAESVKNVPPPRVTPGSSEAPVDWSAY